MRTNFQMFRQFSVGTLVGAILGFGATAARPAFAIQRLIGASCITSSSDGFSSASNYASSAGALKSVYSSSGVGPVFLCPIDNNSPDPAYNYDHCKVYVYDGSSVAGGYAQACAQYSGLTAACSSSTTTSGVGYFTLEPSVYYWQYYTTALDYVFVKLPNAQYSNNSGYSALRGIKAYSD